MELHRIEGAAEWTNVPLARRNVWQRVAAATAGIVTIGNVVSVIGLASIPYGLWLVVHEQHFVWGIIVLGAGRLCDLLDGWLAHKTGTKSPLGESVDAVFDKISLAIVLVVLLATNILPPWAVIAVVLPHVLTAPLAVMARRRGSGLHPSRAGKNGTAVAWAGLVGFVITYFYNGLGDPVLYWLSVGLVLVSLVFGLIAVAGYVRNYRAR